MSTASKLLHWLIFLCFIGLGITAIAANVLFSKEAIMESFAFSFPSLDIDVAPSDQLFIARIARRFTWEIHFWIGLIMISAALLKFGLYLFKRKTNKFLNIFTTIMISVIFLSGLPLYLRIYFDISADIQTFSRGVHFYTIWLFVLFFILHLSHIIYKENNGESDIISKMFHFKGKFFLFLALIMISPQMGYTLEWEKDADYIRAMEYKSGKIGTKDSKKMIENCPYEKCDEVSDDINKNIKSINVKTKNYPQMVDHFRKSVERGNPLAAKILAKFLIGRIDYRSKIPDKTLIMIGERDTGMKYDVYLTLAQKSLEIAAKSKDCYSMYKYAEFHDKGYLGYKRDKDIAKTYYHDILKTCDEKSFFYMMSKSKL